MLVHSPAATSRMSVSISLAAEDAISSSVNVSENKGLTGKVSSMAGGGGRMQEAELVQNTLWRVSHQDESENKAALLLVVHRRKASIKNATRIGMGATFCIGPPPGVLLSCAPARMAIWWWTGRIPCSSACGEAI